MDIVFNEKGAPLLFTGSSVFGNTTGASVKESREIRKTTVQTVDTKEDQYFTEISGVRLRYDCVEKVYHNFLSIKKSPDRIRTFRLRKIFARIIYINKN